MTVSFGTAESGSSGVSDGDIVGIDRTNTVTSPLGRNFCSYLWGRKSRFTAEVHITGERWH